jgi:hypothetical protein
MEIRSYAKQEIAFHQIETALLLFFEAGDLFSVITLAGAAEEILGQLLRRQAEKPGAEGSFRSIFKILRPGNREAVELEELQRAESEESVHMDPYQEASFLLGRAIDDYQRLSGELSAGMLRFNDEVRSRKAESNPGHGSNL